MSTQQEQRDEWIRLIRQQAFHNNAHFHLTPHSITPATYRQRLSQLKEPRLENTFAVLAGRGYGKSWTLMHLTHKEAGLPEDWLVTSQPFDLSSMPEEHSPLTALVSWLHDEVRQATAGPCHSRCGPWGDADAARDEVLHIIQSTTRGHLDMVRRQAASIREFCRTAAHDTLRALTLSEVVATWLDKLAAASRHAGFVLLMDDVDLGPPGAASTVLWAMLDCLHQSRLILVLSADGERLTRTLTDERTPGERNTAEELLAKVLPDRHRLELRPWSASERGGFRPSGTDGSHPPMSLQQLAEARGLNVPSIGPLLPATPRRLLDLWRRLEAMGKTPPISEVLGALTAAARLPGLTGLAPADIALQLQWKPTDQSGEEEALATAELADSAELEVLLPATLAGRDVHLLRDPVAASFLETIINLLDTDPTVPASERVLRGWPRVRHMPAIRRWRMTAALHRPRVPLLHVLPVYDNEGLSPNSEEARVNAAVAWWIASEPSGHNVISCTASPAVLLDALAGVREWIPEALASAYGISRRLPATLSIETPTSLRATYALWRSIATNPWQAVSIAGWDHDLPTLARLAAGLTLAGIACAPLFIGRGSAYTSPPARKGKSEPAFSRWARTEVADWGEEQVTREYRILLQELSKPSGRPAVEDPNARVISDALTPLLHSLLDAPCVKDLR